MAVTQTCNLCTQEAEVGRPEVRASCEEASQSDWKNFLIKYHDFFVLFYIPQLLEKQDLAAVRF